MILGCSTETAAPELRTIEGTWSASLSFDFSDLTLAGYPLGDCPNPCSVSMAMTVRGDGTPAAGSVNGHDAAVSMATVVQLDGHSWSGPMIMVADPVDVLRCTPLALYGDVTYGTFSLILLLAYDERADAIRVDSLLWQLTLLDDDPDTPEGGAVCGGVEPTYCLQFAELFRRVEH